MKCIRHVVVLGILIGVVSGCCGTSKQKYLITIDRPEKVGNKYHVEYHGQLKADTTAMINGEIVNNATDTYSVDIIGTLTVSALASNDSPSSANIVVDTFQTKKNETPLVTAKKGDRLVATILAGSWNSTLLLNDLALDKATACLITGIMSLTEPNRTDRDGVFYGLDSKRQVGERWNINVAAYAKSNPNTDMTGTVEFRGITKADGAEWANIHADMTSKTLPPNVGTLKVKEQQIRTTTSFEVPLGDRPLKMSGDVIQNRNTLMEDDAVNNRVAEHRTLKDINTLTYSFSLTPITSGNSSSGQ